MFKTDHYWLEQIVSNWTHSVQLQINFKSEKVFFFCPLIKKLLKAVRLKGVRQLYSKSMKNIYEGFNFLIKVHLETCNLAKNELSLLAIFLFFKSFKQKLIIGVLKDTVGKIALTTTFR